MVLFVEIVGYFSAFREIDLSIGHEYLVRMRVYPSVAVDCGEKEPFYSQTNLTQTGGSS